MGFVLKLGKGGEEFAFDAKEARLGRTADNDIVVKDAGASRSHARVYQRGTRYFVEDLKSANGTKVNGQLINAPKEVRSGDTVTIGEVTFAFRAVDETIATPPKKAADLNATRLNAAHPTDTGEVDDDDEDYAPQVDRSDTSQMEALQAESVDEEPEAKDDPNSTLLKPPRGMQNDGERERRTQRRSGSQLKDDSTQPPRRGAASPLAVRSENNTMEVQVPPPVAMRRGAVKPEDDDEQSVMTAADKARVRRVAQKTTGGKLLFQFQQLSLPVRVATISLGSLFLIGSIAFFVWAFKPGPTVDIGPEVNELLAGAPPIEHSYGLGEGVTWSRPDMKIFTFTAASPTPVVGVLHYQARDISKDEVTISLNGVELGAVPPDTIDTANRELEVVFPAQHVKLREQNQVVFDSTHNPPGDDPWQIWNIWLEIVAVPQMSRDETITSVKEDMERAQKFFDQRDIGSDNLFKAWKQYRDAWLKLEAMPDRPEELYIAARSQQREIAVLLDKKCANMVLDVQKALNAKRPDRKRAREITDDMFRYFPTREHRCNGLARNLMEEFGGPAALTPPR